MCPHEESNLDRELRKLAFCPLNYGGYITWQIKGTKSQIQNYKSQIILKLQFLKFQTVGFKFLNL